MLKLRMRNWLCYEDTTYDLRDRTFIVGCNAIGKTAIRDAVEFVCVGTGHLRGYRTKIDLAEFSIRKGFESCEVTLECRGVRIRRTMDSEGAQEVFRSVWNHGTGGLKNGWTNEEPMSLKRDQGNPFGDTPDDVLRCMIEPTRFFLLPPERQQELLVQVTSKPKVSYDEALEALGQALVAVGEEDLKALRDAAMWISTKGFRSAEEAAIDHRRVAKRDRDAVVVGEPPEGTFEGIDLSSRPLVAHEEALKWVRREHVAAVQMEAAGAGALQGKLTEAELSLANLEALPAADVSETLRNVEQARADRDELLAEPMEPIPGDAIKIEAVTAHQDSKDAAQAVIEAQATTETARKSIVALEAKLADPAPFRRPPLCPKGPPGMACPVTPSRFETEVTKALGDQTKLGAELDRLRGELTEARDRLGDAEKLADTRGKLDLVAQIALKAALALMMRVEEQISAKADAEAVLAGMLALHDAAETARDATRAEAISRAKARVVQAQVEFDAVRDGLPLQPPIGERASELAERIALGERVVEASRDYWRQALILRDQIERRKEALARIERWDRICQELKPGGIETKMGGDARGAFVALLDQWQLVSGAIQLQEDCGFRVHVLQHGFETWLHPLQLSTSQRLALSIAIQHAFCQLFDFPFLMVDALDTFGVGTTDRWLEVADQLADSYPGGVIGIATIHREPPACPPEPWQTIWLQQGGSVLRMGAGDF